MSPHRCKALQTWRKRKPKTRFIYLTTTGGGSFIFFFLFLTWICPLKDVYYIFALTKRLMKILKLPELYRLEI
jgi:hypothetical protein